MSRRTLIKLLLSASLALMLCLYVGSYLWLSTHGRYEPAAIGLNGVKWYHWAPSGFVTNFRWNQNVGAGVLPASLSRHAVLAHDRRSGGEAIPNQ